MPPAENLIKEVNSRLKTLYGEDSQTPDLDRLVSILKFLADDQADGLKNNPHYVSPHYTILGGEQGSLFQRYADNLVPKLNVSEALCRHALVPQRVNTQPENQIAEDYLPDPDDVLPALYKPRREAGIGGNVVGGVAGLVLSAKILPTCGKAAVINAVRSSAGKLAATAADDAVSLLSGGAGTVVLVGVAAAYISWECYDNIRKWRRGEISGQRCAKNIIDCSVQVAGGMAGGAIGAAVGCAIMPGFGAIAGGLIGGIISSAVALRLSQYITEKIFNLPPTVALENAYKFVGIDQSVSNGELNTAFRKKCLKFHPDKGGNADDFYKLQCHFSIIKASREEKQKTI